MVRLQNFVAFLSLQLPVVFSALKAPFRSLAIPAVSAVIYERCGALNSTLFTVWCVTDWWTDRQTNYFTIVHIATL